MAVRREAQATPAPISTLQSSKLQQGSSPHLPAPGKIPVRAFPAASDPAPSDAIDDRDSYAVTALAEIVDRSLHATAARFTLGLSPAALAYACSAPRTTRSAATLRSRRAR